MIETTIPEINVFKLMERVRAKAAELNRPRPKPRMSRPLRSEKATSLPPVAMLPAAPAVWIPDPVKSRKERLDSALQTAREKNEPDSRIPKFLRRFFRRQGGYNRAVLDGMRALAKSNQEVTQRVADISVCLAQFNSWLLALHDQSDADANWMKAAAPAISTIGSLTAEVEGAHAAIKTLRSEKRSVLEAEHLAERVQKCETEILERTGLLQRKLEEVGLHLRNLQAQTDAIGADAGTLREDWRNASERNEEKSKGLQQQVDQAALHLRTLQAQADRLGTHINNLQGFLDNRVAETNALHRALEQRLEDHAGLTQRITAFEERTVADGVFIKGQLSEFGALFPHLLGDDLAKPRGAGRKDALSTKTKAVPGMDSFYVAFEDRFRGPRSEIKKRVEFYLPFIRKCRAGSSTRPVLDVGCGRGEWLELLKENKLEGHGVDINTTMVAQCKARGFKVELRDALAYLRSARANTVGAVTGFHIIEHLSFEMLLDLFRQTRRVLKPGGVAIFESPNCKNLIVGACNFHIDPTHRHPVFPESAELMLASQGFEKIRIEYLSPVADVKFSANTPELATIKDLLYGPQDFGIIAYKPRQR